MPNLMQNSFNNGEITPRLGGRVDLAKYGSSLETCLNALPQPHGGVSRRSGTQFIAACKNQNKRARLLPFEYSTTQAYIVEAGDAYARFYMDGGQIWTYDTYTKLCIQGSGTNASTNITDDTGLHTVTASGTAKIDTDPAHTRFGDGSVQFGFGGAGLLTVGDHADWFMDSGTFSIDFFLEIYSLSVEQGIFCQYLNSTTKVVCHVATSGVMVFEVLSGGTYVGLTLGYGLIPGWRYHIAIGREAGNIWYLKVDGYTRVATVNAQVWPDMAADFLIGRSYDPASGSSTQYNLTGWIEMFRVRKGDSIYSNAVNFTPPTVRYPLSGSGGGIVYELSTWDYTESQLAAIKYCQSADVLYLTHPDHPPAKLTRTAHTTWTLTDITFAWPPFDAENITATTIDPDATAVGGVNLVASPALFDADWEGFDIKFGDGYLNVTTVSTTTQAAGSILAALATTGSADLAASTEWSRSAWSTDNGYPTCVMFYEERLSFAATAAHPQTEWLSVSGDYENFNAMEGATITDTDACTYTISSDQVNAIRWMAPTKKLTLGTTGGEWLMYGPNDAGITPSNIKADGETFYGSADMQPVRIGNAVIFVQRGGKKIREFGYTFQTDSYSATELTVLAEHLTRNNKIVDMAFQKRPNQVLWCVRDDGDLIALTYLKEHEVVGWSHHDVGGVVESVAVIPGSEEDEVWLIVRRVRADGITVRYIERLKQEWDGEDVADAFYVDCGLSYSGAAVSVVTGLSHLEGTLVNILADGVPQAATTVSGYSLSNLATSSKFHVGLPMTTDIKTLRCGAVEVQGGIKRIIALVVRFFETAGSILTGSSAADADTRDLGDTPVTEDVLFTMPTGYDTEGQVFIRKTDALPMTILSVMPKLESFNELDGL